jgi:hypothetical protein
MTKSSMRLDTSSLPKRSEGGKGYWGVLYDSKVVSKRLDSNSDIKGVIEKNSKFQREQASERRANKKKKDNKLDPYKNDLFLQRIQEGTTN